jgi:hypothetical protein
MKPSVISITHTGKRFPLFALYLKNREMYKILVRTKFVDNFMLYNFSNNPKCHLEQRKRDIYEKPIFATFDLQYLDSRTRDSMRLLSQLIKNKKKYYLNSMDVNDFSDEIFGNMHDFVLNLYSKNADITSINTLLGLMAASTSFPKLPPTKDALKHIA